MVVDAGEPHLPKVLRHVLQRGKSWSSVEILEFRPGMLSASQALSLVVGLAAWFGGRADRRVSEDIRKPTTTDCSCMFAASRMKEEMQQLNQTLRERKGP